MLVASLPVFAYNSLDKSCMHLAVLADNIYSRQMIFDVNTALTMAVKNGAKNSCGNN
jgi:hypothetical protein